MCCFNNNGTLDISEKVINNTVELTKQLMSKYNIPIENVIRHYDVTHKCCPAPFVNNANRWKDFKNRLVNQVEVSDLEYKAHIQDIGWTDWKRVGEIAGTAGEGKRVEAIILQGNNGLDLSYRVHIESMGWTGWESNGQVCGTTGQSKRIEAIEIQSNKMLEVQEHIESVGWMPSSKGTYIKIGTEGKSLRLEAFKIRVM